MVSKKKTTVKKSVGKLRLRKETIRDLNAKGKSSEVKGGRRCLDSKPWFTESCAAGC